MRGDEQFKYSATLAQLKEQFAPKELESEWHRGKILSLEQAVEDSVNFGDLKIK